MWSGAGVGSNYVDAATRWAGLRLHSNQGVGLGLGLQTRLRLRLGRDWGRNHGWDDF